MPKLTDELIADTVVPAGKRDVLIFDNGHDRAVRGFGVRIYGDGRASYFIKYTVNGQQRRLTLGDVRPGNVNKMREHAEDVRTSARKGEDILGDQKAKAAEQKAAETAATVGALVKVFLTERELMTRKVIGGKAVTPTLRLRTHEQSERYLTQHCQPLHRLVIGTVTQGAQAGVVDLEKRWAPINGHKLEIIARSHVVQVIDTVARDRGRVAADRCKTALSTFLAWCIDQGFCDANPTMHIKARATNGSRERVLSDQELAEVWRACGNDDFGNIVRLLLLTGCRAREIGDLCWSELHIGERLLKLPSARVKNKRAHAVWLSDQALTIIKSIPPGGNRDLVFGRGAGGFGGWSLCKAKLDKRIAEARAKTGLDDMPAWVLHDLRRSFSTRTNDLGLGAPWFVEACLNHVVGGVHSTYNRAEHEAGKRGVRRLRVLIEAAWLRSRCDSPRRACVQYSAKNKTDFHSGAPGTKRLLAPRQGHPEAEPTDPQQAHSVDRVRGREPLRVGSRVLSAKHVVPIAVCFPASTSASTNPIAPAWRRELASSPTLGRVLLQQAGGSTRSFQIPCR